MRGFLLGVCALVAACSGDGVYVEVRVPSGMAVDQVDLYLATTSCTPEAGFDCEGIVPPGAANATRARVEGEVYFVDDNRPFVSTPDGDGSAWFHLDPSSQLQLETAIAVGRDGSGGESGVAIFLPIDLAVTQHVRIDLEPVASQEVRGQAQPAVEVWGPVGDAYRCVAAEVEDRVVYVVPKDDPDCDQVSATQECLPGVHLGHQATSSELVEQTCATPLATGLCVLGSEGCDERSQPDAGGCTATTEPTYCTTDRVCVVCADSLDPVACFKELFDLGSGIECTIEIEPDPTNGGPATRTCVNKEVASTTIGDATCDQPEISVASDLLNFATSVTVPLPDGTTGVKVKPIVGNGCNFSVEPPNATFPSSAASRPIFSLVKLEVTPPGDLVPRFLLLPLKVAFVPVTNSCDVGGSTVCQLRTQPGDHFPLCLK